MLGPRKPGIELERFPLRRIHLHILRVLLQTLLLADFRYD
jgi:hypothetical protein